MDRQNGQTDARTNDDAKTSSGDNSYNIVFAYIWCSTLYLT